MKDRNTMITVVLAVLVVISLLQAVQLTSMTNQVTAAVPAKVSPYYTVPPELPVYYPEEQWRDYRQR